MRVSVPRAHVAHRVLAILAGALALLIAMPGVSIAGLSGWPLEGPAEVATAFGARYPSGAGESTHRGVDLRAEPGDAVVAPCSGSVTFVGRVPAVGTSGSVLSCTIERADGVRFTLMPIEAVAISVGERLESGVRVAEVAERGDASSSQSHLHVGARKGDLYVDPLDFLVPPLAAAESAPEATPPNVPAAAATPAPVHEPETASVPEVAPAVAPAVPAPIESASPASAEAGTERVETAETPLPAQPAPASSPAHVPGAVPAVQPGYSQAVESVAADPRSSVPVGIVSPVAGLLAAASPFAASPVTVGEQTAESAVMAPRDTGAVEPIHVSGPVARSSGRASDQARLASVLSSLAGRAVPIAGRSASRLGRAWLVALIALLAATGALWPLWRREPTAREPEVCLVACGE